MDQKPSKYFFVAAVALFIIFIIFGAWLELSNPNLGDTMIGSFVPFSFFNNLSPIELFFVIFLNNSLKALLVIILGVVFGLFPIYFLYTNGLLIGVVGAAMWERFGILPVFAGLLPHGIFELTAILIASSYGFWLGASLIKTIKKEGKLLPSFKRSLSVYLKVVLPLLFVAAIIETWITPSLLNAVLP